LEVCAVEQPRLVIADLQATGILDAVRDLRGDPKTAAVRIVGFYSHVEVATRDAALAAGVSEALPRSAFTARLAELLKS
jgi:CheY-like chemotaxis protein